MYRNDLSGIRLKNQKAIYFFRQNPAQGPAGLLQQDQRQSPVYLRSWIAIEIEKASGILYDVMCSDPLTADLRAFFW